MPVRRTGHGAVSRSPGRRAAGPHLRLVLLGLLLMAPATSAQDLDEAASWAVRLDAEDVDQRRAAIHALADRGGPEAVEWLSARLEQESDDLMRRVIHDALLRVPMDEAALSSILSDSTVVAARAFAAHSLGRRRTPGAITVLLAAMRDPEPAVRREVYEALGASGDRTAIQELIKAAVRESSPPLREQAELAAQQLAEGTDKPRDVLVAISRLQGGSIDDRLWAVEVLAESGDWRAYHPLLSAARGTAPELQREAIKGLGLLGDHRAVPELHGLRDDTSGRTRHFVIGALALLADESSLEVLAGLVDDVDPASRVLAIRAISALEHPGAAQAILPALDDPEEPVRTEAIHALGRARGPASNPGLIRAMGDPSPFLRAEAARLLASSGEMVGDPLLAGLEDKDPLVRLTCAEGLALLGDERALPRLEELARSTRDSEQRAIYERAAARLGAASPPVEP
jgi:HEAT repeat protein